MVQIIMEHMLYRTLSTPPQTMMSTPAKNPGPQVERKRPPPLIINTQIADKRLKGKRLAPQAKKTWVRRQEGKTVSASPGGVPVQGAAGLQEGEVVSPVAAPGSSAGSPTTKNALLLKELEKPTEASVVSPTKARSPVAVVEQQVVGDAALEPIVDSVVAEVLDEECLQVLNSIAADMDRLSERRALRKARFEAYRRVNLGQLAGDEVYAKRLVAQNYKFTFFDEVEYVPSAFSKGLQLFFGVKKGPLVRGKLSTLFGSKQVKRRFTVVPCPSGGLGHGGPTLATPSVELYRTTPNGSGVDMEESVVAVSTVLGQGMQTGWSALLGLVRRDPEYKALSRRAKQRRDMAELKRQMRGLEHLGADDLEEWQELVLDQVIMEIGTSIPYDGDYRQMVYRKLLDKFKVELGKSEAKGHRDVLHVARKAARVGLSHSLRAYQRVLYETDAIVCSQEAQRANAVHNNHRRRQAGGFNFGGWSLGFRKGALGLGDLLQPSVRLPDTQ
jgi:hypothetical protein